MSEPHLIHVGTTEALAVRLFDPSVAPDWLPGESTEGVINVRRWDADHLMIEVSIGVVGEQHAVRVTVGGLYAMGSEDLFAQPEEEQNDFARRQMDELMPFVRQAVYNASSQVWPVKPILLDARSGISKVHERTDS